MQVFSRHAGRDLTPFVNQWLTRTGGPRLSLAAVESRPVEGGWLVSGKIIQSPPPWAIPVNLSMATAGASWPPAELLPGLDGDGVDIVLDVVAPHAAPSARTKTATSPRAACPARPPLPCGERAGERGVGFI
jgi:hypothetical protein